LVPVVEESANCWTPHPVEDRLAVVEGSEPRDDTVEEAVELVVERVPAGTGFPTQVAASVVMVEVEDLQTTDTGVVAWRTRFPLLKELALSISVALKPTATAIAGTRTVRIVGKETVASALATRRRGLRV
jgi:chorismate synthase